MSILPQNPTRKTRVILLITGVVTLLILANVLTGNPLPNDPLQSLIFQGGFLLVIFGSLLLEDKFTKPADAVINGIAAIISLVPVYPQDSDSVWWLLVVYSTFVSLVGLINITISSETSTNKFRIFASDKTYQLSTILGKAKLIYSAIFLYAVFSYYDTRSTDAAILLGVWAVYMAIFPLKIPNYIDRLLSSQASPKHKGTIVRVDSPNLIRVKLNTNSRWSGEIIGALGDGSKRKIVPLFKRVQDSEVIGTGLLAEVAITVRTMSTGFVYYGEDVLNEEENPVNEQLVEMPVGIVVEGSQIGKIHFETWHPEKLREGVLIHCSVLTKSEDKVITATVYYQVTDAATTEEAFESHRHGFQVVEAHQLGVLDPVKGFKKFVWLPQMNTPVYLAGSEVQTGEKQLESHEMILGTVPGSNIEIVCNLNDMISHHTAILGVTGSGKTELALKLIRKAISDKVKVFCVDITGDYIDVLDELDPQELSLSESLSKELGEKLHDVETGKFGAPDEKKVLQGFTDRLRNEISSSIESFLKSDNQLGLFTMRSISNTKATILATEIYLSSIFSYGRQKKNGENILVVLEEAHTVIPEASTMGLGDYESRGMVAKIAQIALQGRKYGVGLLVIAQRTATVSKTVLTQCNTVITFSSFDQTGLNFLSNIYGEQHTSKISNLPPYHALAFGKGVKTERPIIVDLYDKSLDD